MRSISWVVVAAIIVSQLGVLSPRALGQAGRPCCFADGSCQIRSAYDCLDEGGIWQPLAKNCGVAPCTAQQPIGGISMSQAAAAGGTIEFSDLTCHWTRSLWSVASAINPSRRDHSGRQSTGCLEAGFSGSLEPSR